MDPSFSALADAAARLYIPTGRYAWRFVRGKLRFDPVFRHLLGQRLVPDSGRLLDLGCGYGVLMAMLIAARARHARSDWPTNWPVPPHNLEMHGVELRPDRARAAQDALQGHAHVEQGDIRSTELPPSKAIVILDVLLYLNGDEQRVLLERVVRALQPGGVLLLREADAAAGLRFGVTRWAARVADIRHGGLQRALHYRSADHWAALLQELNLSVRAQPMSAGTPFANVLLVARKQDASGAQRSAFDARAGALGPSHARFLLDCAGSANRTSLPDQA
jgi:SAM-dependent methyltransferase